MISDSALLFEVTFQMKMKLIVAMLCLALLCMPCLGQEKTAEDWTAEGLRLAANGSASLEPALYAFEQAIRLDPESIDAWYQKAEAHRTLSRVAFQKALDLSISWLDRDPHDPLAWQSKGAALDGLDRDAEADEAYLRSIQLLNQRLEKDPTDGESWFLKAENYANMKMNEEAIWAYDRVIELDHRPRLLDAWNTKAIFLAAMGRYDESLLASEEALKIDPKSETAHVNKGYVLRKLGRQAEADFAFSKAQAVRRGEGSGFSCVQASDLARDNRSSLVRGKEQLRQSSFEEALESFDLAIRQDPRNAEAWTNRGFALGGLRRTEESIAAYQKALQLTNATLQNQPDNATSWFVRGDALSGLGRDELALCAYDEALQIEPDNAEFWSARGTALQTLGLITQNLSTFQESLAAYDRSLDLNPDDSLVWLQKGAVLAIMAYQLPRAEQTSAFEDAIRAYDWALEVDPSHVEAWISKGNVYTSLGLIDGNLSWFNQSLFACDQAISLTPETQTRRLAMALEAKAVSLSLMGRSLFRQGLGGEEASSMQQEALKLYDRVLELDPVYVRMGASQNRAALLMELGRQDEADLALQGSLEPYDEIIQSDPDSSVAWVGRAILLRELGKYDEAILSLDKAISADPRYLLAWEIKGSILCEDVGEYGQSLKVFELVLASDSNSTGALLLTASALHALGRDEEALAAYNRTLDRDPELSRAWYGRGEALRALGREDQAIIAYDRAIELSTFGPDRYSLIGKGLALQSLGRRKEAKEAFYEALRDYDRVVGRNPRNSQVLKAKGDALLGLGRPDEALKAYESAIELNPRFIAAHLGKCLALKARGDQAGAETAWDLAKELGYQGGHKSPSILFEG
ncbi:MAG: lipoprotein NlpI [Methanosaeta sp. PtaB.Bin039]|nr:MAG: lipoprotein NlpI [Methanosaeta sp. PtaB.Bin039]